MSLMLSFDDSYDGGDSKLGNKKKNIKAFEKFFRRNFDTYKKMYSFVYHSTINEETRANLDNANKPVAEFSSLYPYLGRVMGEFTTQEPGVEVSREYDDPNSTTQMATFIRNHLRYIFTRSKYEMSGNYRNQICGGFAAYYLRVDYKSKDSFDLDFYIENINDPTTVGWDPNAILPDKSDGDFCYRSFLYNKSQFIEAFGEAAFKKLKKQSGMDVSEIDRNINKPFIKVYQYFEKEYFWENWYELSNKMVLSESQYESFKNELMQSALFGIMPNIPQIVKTKKCRDYRIKEHIVWDKGIIETNDTYYRNLPLKFVANDTSIIYENKEEIPLQYARSYFKDVVGYQTLKNISGSYLAARLEETMPLKIIYAEGSVPEDAAYLYENLTGSNNFPYRPYDEKGKPLEPPRFAQSPPMSPEIWQIFSSADAAIQGNLGTFSQAQGQVDADISNKTYIDAVTQSNLSLAPTIESQMMAIESLANDIVKLMPNVYSGRKSLMIKNTNGTTETYNLNENDLNYSESTFKVCVKAGANFEAQAARSVNTLINLMKINPKLSAFISEVGIPTLLDNIPMPSIDPLKEAYPEFSKKYDQAQQMAGQQNPMQIEMKKLQLKEQENQLKAMQIQGDIQVKSAQVSIQKQLADIEAVLQMHNIRHNQSKIDIENQKLETENKRTDVEAASAVLNHAMNVKDMHHKHLKESTQVLHDVVKTHLSNNKDNDETKDAVSMPDETQQQEEIENG